MWQKSVGVLVLTLSSEDLSATNAFVAVEQLSNSSLTGFEQFICILW
jgi:hypothetical protein